MIDSLGRKPVFLLCMFVASVSCITTIFMGGLSFKLCYLLTKCTVAGAFTLVRLQVCPPSSERPPTDLHSKGLHGGALPHRPEIQGNQHLQVSVRLRCHLLSPAHVASFESEGIRNGLVRSTFYTRTASDCLVLVYRFSTLFSLSLQSSFSSSYLTRWVSPCPETWRKSSS